MSIKIRSNDNGACIVFEGTTQPAYWYSCLRAEVDGEDPTRINIINDLRSGDGTEYEFYKISYTEFIDEDDNTFTDAPTVAQYINERVSPSVTTGGTTFEQTEHMDFERDATNTTVMFGNGDTHGVNSIVAVDAGDGTVNIQTTKANVLLYQGLNHENLTIANADAGATLTSVVNALNAYFTVSPVSAGGEAVLSFNVDGGQTVSGSLAEGQTPTTGTPVHLYTTAGDTSSGHGARFWSNDTIDQAGEYFTVKITGKGRFLLGLTDQNDATAQAELQNDTGSAKSGVFWSNAFYNYGYIAPWTVYQSESGMSLSYGPGWNGSQSQQMRYNTDVQDSFDDMTSVLFRVGINEQGYIAVWYWDEGRSNDWIMTARRGKATPAGNYALVVKLWDGNTTLVEYPEVFHLPVDDTPTAIGDSNITIFGDATGTLAGGIVVTDATDDNDGFITDQVISQPGEYFECTWSVGDASFGLFSENDHDVQDAVDDRSDWSGDDYVFYGARLEDNGTLTNALQDNNWSSTTTLGDPSTANYYSRVGFDLSGRATVWMSADGTTWDVFHRSNAAAPTGDYKFIWVAQNDNANLDSLSQGQLEAALQLTYYFIESPDSSYHYPLFATAEEAEQYDSDNGGSGDHVERTFIDDVTPGRIWYSPVAGYNANESSAPVDTSEITYNRIHTEDDQDYAPTAFAGLDVTVDELSAVNIQVTPQDVTWQTSVSFSPATPGLSLVGTNIEGTAPEVADNNVANPSDTITVTVSRTNNYGTSTGTFDIIVNNLTAPTTAISGYTWESASTPLVDSTTLDDGSAVSLDDTLQSVRRLIIDKAYVETHILPNLQEAGDKVYIGVADGSADWSTVEDADWDAYIMWEWQGSNSHYSRLVEVGGQSSTTVVSSLTSALYDYAIEVEGTDLSLIACNINAIMNEPSVVNGGQFSRDLTISSYGGTLPATIHIASVGTGCTIDENDLAEVEIPLPDGWIQVTASAHVLAFDGSATMPTLQAGYTYRFLMGDLEYKDGTTTTHLHADDDIRFTADGGTTEYTTGITRVGNPNDPGAYIEFVVPTDVPPLQWYTDHDSSLNGTTINGSTYVVSITGVTQEGPAANQTGTNLFDVGDHGWISLDEPLGAGERLVLDGAFFSDLVSAMPDKSAVYIGLKDTGWTDAFSVLGLEGRTYIYINRQSSSDVRFQIQSNGSATNQLFTTVAAMSGFGAFIDITSTGNNIRIGYTYSGDGSSDDESATAYADWGSSRKLQTGDQGYGITSVDVMILAGAAGANITGMDADDVDWTGLTEINVPAPATTNTTSWTKALDFSGGSEHTKQVSNDVNYNPIMMAGNANLVSGNSTAGYTASASGARPWACACVFKIDGNNSNQHIWNVGEGAGSNDDNIYLRSDSNRRVYFGWGRSGAINELYLGTFNTTDWHAVYVGFTGERLSGSNATAANLADCFDVRHIHSGNSFNALSGNKSTSINWSSSLSTTGGRMDRGVTGNTTIGGRGGNRNFHGKVASMVVTTLRQNVPMPTDAEIMMMIKDPDKWITDYKEGNSYRLPAFPFTATFARGEVASARATQVWLMGDVAGDGFAQMRNLVYPATQNDTPQNMISMVSNDIQNVTIPGLS